MKRFRTRILVSDNCTENHASSRSCIPAGLRRSALSFDDKSGMPDSLLARIPSITITSSDSLQMPARMGDVDRLEDRCFVNCYYTRHIAYVAVADACLIFSTLVLAF
jgi:hypothetical protein